MYSEVYSGTFSFNTFSEFTRVHKFHSRVKSSITLGFQPLHSLRLWARDYLTLSSHAFCFSWFSLFHCDLVFQLFNIYYIFTKLCGLGWQKACDTCTCWGNCKLTPSRRHWIVMQVVLNILLFTSEFL